MDNKVVKGTKVKLNMIIILEQKNRKLQIQIDKAKKNILTLENKILKLENKTLKQEQKILKLDKQKTPNSFEPIEISKKEIRVLRAKSAADARKKVWGETSDKS